MAHPTPIKIFSRWTGTAGQSSVVWGWRDALTEAREYRRIFPERKVVITKATMEDLYVHRVVRCIPARAKRVNTGG